MSDYKKDQDRLLEDTKQIAKQKEARRLAKARKGATMKDIIDYDLGKIVIEELERKPRKQPH